MFYHDLSWDLLSEFFKLLTYESTNGKLLMNKQTRLVSLFRLTLVSPSISNQSIEI